MVFGFSFGVGLLLFSPFHLLRVCRCSFLSVGFLSQFLFSGLCDGLVLGWVFSASAFTVYFLGFSLIKALFDFELYYLGFVVFGVSRTCVGLHRFLVPFLLLHDLLSLGIICIALITFYFCVIGLFPLGVT